MGYCLPKSDLYPYESLWSIVHKFAYWNVCGIKEIVEELHQNRHLKCESRFRSLLYAPPWDFNKLAEGLNVDVETISLGVATGLLVGEGWDELVCHDLRYCTECIKGGYHSIVHQLYLFEECPYHQVPLKSKCRKCEKGISLSFESKTIKNYYGCNRCCEKLYKFIGYPVINREEIERVFGSIIKVLKTRVATMVNCAGLNCYLPHNATETKKRESYDLLWQFWESLYSDSTSFKIEFATSKVYAETNSTRFNYRKAYISYLKLLHDKWVGSHVYCVEQALKCNYFLSNHQKQTLVRFCPVAYALIVWRMYWEAGHINTRVCILGHLDVSDENISKQVKWVHESMIQDEIAAAIFKYECESTWWSSYTYSKDMIDKGIFCVPCRQLPKSVLSHWEVAINKNTNTFILAKIPLPPNRIDPLPMTNDHRVMMDEFVSLQDSHRKQIHQIYHPRS